MEQDREKFGVSMEAQLKAWQESIEESKAAAEEKGPDFWALFKPEVDKLTSLYEEARYKFKLLRMNTGEAWDELRQGLEKAGEQLKAALAKAREKL